MRSKKSIIEQHIEFCKQHNIEVTQDQLNKWSQIPARFLAKFLVRDRIEIGRGWSQYATHTFN